MNIFAKDIFQKRSELCVGIVAGKNYHYFLNGFVALQLALLVFSLLYTNSAMFFFCLKALLALGAARIVLEQPRRDPYWSLDWLVLLPGIWGGIYGFSSGNIGAKNEFTVFVMAPLVYLLIFHKPAMGPSSLKYLEPALQAICAVNLLVFYFLFFVESGSLRSVLEAATLFRIQFPDGYAKVYTLQITSLIFLLPVMAGYYYFRQSWKSFFLVTAALLMALLSGRKAMLVLFTALSMSALLYHAFRHRDLKTSVKLLAPWFLALMLFTQIAVFDKSAYFQAMFNSFPELGGLVKHALSGNTCAMENYMDAGLASDKLGAVVRQAQITTLVKEIATAPWFGKGLGYVAVDCIRSEQQPWRFELTYLGVVLNTGLVGLAILAFVYLRWVKKAMSSLLPGHMSVPLLCGSAFYLISSASNPYILAVEYLWIFFIPFLLSRWAPEDGATEPKHVGVGDVA